jgi:type I restriction enzyme S subunit
VGEWPRHPIGDLVVDILDRRGVTPLKLGSDFTSAGHRVVSAKLIKAGRIDLAADEPRFVDEATYARWMRTPLQADDVILTSEAPLGQLAYLTSDVDWVLGQRLFCLRTDKRRLNGRFLYYALQTDPARGDLQSRATGTTAQGIRQSELRRVRVPVPPLKEQLQIARILGALDDKIELNHRLAEQLDRAARAIFHGWFIADPAVVSWPVASLAEVFEVNPSRPLSRITPAAYLDMANMPTSGPSALGVATRIPGSGARFENGDTLLARITPCLENGKTALVDFLPPGKRGWGSTEFIVLRPREPLPEPFAYCLARQPEFVTYAVARMNGSSGRQRVSAAAISEFEIRTPPPELAMRFGSVVRPIFDRIAVARRESRTLIALRDALLPRLLSGETSPPSGRGQVA